MARQLLRVFCGSLILMANASNISQRSPPRRCVNVKTVLAVALLAELLAWWLLRGDFWRKLGLGWQFWSLVVATAAMVTLAASAGVWFVRRRMQFGLRSLFVLVLFVGTSLGLLGMQLQNTEKQRRAAAALAQIGAGVSYSGENQPGLLTFVGRQYFQEPVAVGFQGALCENDLANIEALTGLELLTLCNSQLSDADLAHFSSLRQLCTLGLIGTRVTGQGLAHLHGTGITKQGTHQLQRALPNCAIVH